MYIKKSLSKAIGLTKPTKPTLHFLQLAILLFFAAQNICGQSDSLMQLRAEARSAYFEILEALHTATGSQREQLLQQFETMREHYHQRLSDMGVNTSGSGRTQTTTSSRSGFDYYVSADNTIASDSNPGTESAPFRTIQHAINFASDGDRIKIADGKYDEKIAITLMGIDLIGNPDDPASVIIDGGTIVNSSPVVSILSSGWWNQPNLMKGFTITGGNNGGIYSVECYGDYSNLIITGCNNFVFNLEAYPSGALKNMLIYGNQVNQLMYISYNPDLVIVNSTIVNNTVQQETIWTDSYVGISNCIIRNPGCTYEISGGGVSYCNVAGGTSKITGASTSNITDTDPQFVDPVTGKYQLSPTSINCIDAGDPNPIWNDVNFPPSYGSARNDLGAYGGPHASDQPYQFVPEPPVIPDVTGADPNSSLLFTNNNTNIGFIGPDTLISGQNVNNLGIYVYGPNDLDFWTDAKKRMTITGTGNVGIGTADPTQKLHVVGSSYFDGNVGIGTSNPAQKLHVEGDVHVEGGIRATGAIRANEIIASVNGADFVFEPDYRLRPLPEVEQFIAANKHLPDIAPADSMAQNGVNMGEMQMTLLQKIEELTLYTIEQQKQINALRQEIETLKSEKDEQ